MPDFHCPRCGGHTFGTRLDDDLMPCEYRCTSDCAGRPLSLTNEEFEAGLLSAPRDKPCGWRGKEFPEAP